MKVSLEGFKSGDGSNGSIPFITPRDGSLINDQGTVYLITNNHRQGFSSPQSFLGLGYSFSNVLIGDTSFLPTLSPINSSNIPHPSGTVVNDNGTICVIESVFRNPTNPGRKCFSTLADMNSWGGQKLKNNKCKQL